SHCGSPSAAVADATSKRQKAKMERRMAQVPLIVEMTGTPQKDALSAFVNRDNTSLTRAISNTSSVFRDGGGSPGGMAAGGRHAGRRGVRPDRIRMGAAGRPRRSFD